MATAVKTKTKTKTDRVEPLDDRLVIRPAAPDEMSKGGIVIPAAAQEKQSRGTVVAVGPGRLLDGGERGEMQIKEGDVVLYGKYAGTEITVGDDELTIIRETDVLARLAPK